MFTLSEELKWYEPGLEVVEESLSGDQQKDLLEMMRLLMKEKISAAGKLEETGDTVEIEETAETAETPEKEKEEQAVQETPAE